VQRRQLGESDQFPLSADEVGRALWYCLDTDRDVPVVASGSSCPREALHLGFGQLEATGQSDDRAPSR
jgi:hypothetical protein